MSEPITLTFTHSEKEFVAATRLFYARVYHTRFRMVISSIVLCLGLILILLDQAFILGSVAAVGGFILLVLNFFAHFVTSREYFQRNAKFREQYNLRFSEEGLLFRSKDLESKLEWRFYSNVWETPRFYFLRYDKDLFTLIPKRVFISKTQESAFRDLLKRKISANFETQGYLEGESGALQGEYSPPQSPPDWR